MKLLATPKIAYVDYAKMNITIYFSYSISSKKYEIT